MKQLMGEEMEAKVKEILIQTKKETRNTKKRMQTLEMFEAVVGNCVKKFIGSRTITEAVDKKKITKGMYSIRKEIRESKKGKHVKDVMAFAKKWKEEEYMTRNSTRS